ncbi:MAG: hypothetical protein KA998_01190 [Rickettsiaceae bacterium]|nr:hypothetical protein [Rickettsiaceae bacterium]
MTEFVPITVAYGDGIGPEIIHSVLRILKEAKARIRVEIVEIGENLYRKYYTSGIAGDSLENLARTKWLLKGPIFVPDEEGYIDFTESLSQKLGLSINLHNIISWEPNINVKIINGESGLSYAKKHHRKSSLSKLYNLDEGHLKIDFEGDVLEHVIVSEKKNQDDILGIISQMMPGQIRMSSKAKIGKHYGIFEASCDAGDEIAGDNVANPSAMIGAAVSMLKIIEQGDVAKIIEDSWRDVISRGIHTKEIYDPAISKKLASTTEFTEAIVDRILSIQ